MNLKINVRALHNQCGLKMKMPSRALHNQCGFKQETDASWPWTEELKKQKKENATLLRRGEDSGQQAGPGVNISLKARGENSDQQAGPLG